MEYSYTLSDKGVIVAVSDNWDAFAEANNGAEACAKHVLGQPWTRFVSDKETRLLYRYLLNKARQSRTTVSVPFRCDGPAVRRYMEMLLQPHPDSSVTIRCSVVREEPRDSVRLLDRNQTRTKSHLRMCSWCEKVLVKSQWVEVEAAVRLMSLFDPEPVPALTHGLCPSCLAAQELPSLKDPQESDGALP